MHPKEVTVHKLSLVESQELQQDTAYTKEQSMETEYCPLQKKIS